MSKDEYKSCPYCGEEIKKKAIKCKYCQTNLEGDHNDERRIKANEAQSLSSKSVSEVLHEKQKMGTKENNSKPFEHQKESIPKYNKRITANNIEKKWSGLTTVFIVISSVVGVAGILLLSEATAGVGAIALACMFGIFARVHQAYEQHKEIMKREK